MSKEAQLWRSDDRSLMVEKFESQWKSIFTNEFCRVHDYYRRGATSVKNTGLAIYQLPCVEFVDIVRPFSPADVRDKLDLIVCLNNQGEQAKVGVQIKSSDHYLYEFLREYDTDESVAWEKLAKDKLILINGQNSPEKIQEDFNRQLENIRSIGRSN